jgi:Tfp pilus assembly protein PilX
MTHILFRTTRSQNRESQRGAALVTVLMISTLLMATGGTLVLVTSMASRTAIDSTAEIQAYYAAEAGLSNTLNVLRGNVAPKAAMPAGTQMSFRNAVTKSTSNLPSDSSNAFRLSGWLNYDSSSGTGSPDRVALSANYTAQTGLAYNVELTDPDNTPVANGEPSRLLLRVTGYGPKGAVKKMELIVRRSGANYSPPAMLMMRGADSGAAVNFTIGESNAKEYTGHDNATTAVLPAFGATSNGDKAIELGSTNKETVADPIAATISLNDLPNFLQSASQARAFLADQKQDATDQGRYFTTFSGYAGTADKPAFTFVDGDCSLDGGSGLLIVTGKLLMKGNPTFKGLILVLGEGYVERDGGGNGDFLGAMAVAKFDPTSGPFLAPTFMTNGGGTSTMKYDSTAVRQALNVAGPRVLGVHEY